MNIKKKKQKHRRFFRNPNGKRESATFSTSADADRWLLEKKRGRELTRAGLQLDFEPITVQDWAARWLQSRKTHGKPFGSWRQDETRLRLYILPDFGDHHLHEVSTAKWSMCLDNAMIDGDLSAATRNRIRSLLSKLYNDGICFGYCLSNPISKIRRLDEALEQWDYLETVEQIDRYLTEAWKMGPAFGIFASVSLNTGLRMCEVTALNLSDFDLSGNRIRVAKIYDPEEGKVVPRTKGKRCRYVGINKSLRSAYGRFLEVTGVQRKDTLLVSDPDNREILRPRKIRSLNEEVCRRAGIKAITPHDLRHTYASHFVMNGGSLTSLQALLGHSSYSTTLKYSHLSPMHLQAQAGVVEFEVHKSTALDNVRKLDIVRSNLKS